MKLLRRDFLKYCIGSAAALGLEFSTLGPGEGACHRGRHSLPGQHTRSPNIYTTLEQTVNSRDSPPAVSSSARIRPTIVPCDIDEYAANGYGEWNSWAMGPASLIVSPNMPYRKWQNPPVIGTS